MAFELKSSQKADTEPKLIASVDLGSNSFRMVIAQIVETPSGYQLRPVDTLRDSIKLAAGLDSEKNLDAEAVTRGLNSIRRFGERLRNFSPMQVRVVATNTFRVARNASKFIAQAELALGFPIEVIAGQEEARLVYIGASHGAPANSGNRLVIDIGGGSTEFIIGQGYEPKLLESLYIGCVSHSQKFFANGAVDSYNFKQAELAARQEIQIISKEFRKKGWDQVIGSSGTAKALAELISLNGLDVHSDRKTDPFGVEAAGVITRQSLELLKLSLIESEFVQNSKLIGLKPDRRLVLPGGLAIMIAAFDELKIESMEIVEAALRMGVLYDFLGRAQHHDMRFVTVEQFMKRYGVDVEQAMRVEELAIFFLEQFPMPVDEDRINNTSLLGWAARLHEIGLTISHNGYHKHSAYISANADMPGFSKNDQARLSTLLIGHTGKLAKVYTSNNFVDWRMLFCLRLAFLLSRRRVSEELPEILVQQTSKGFKVTISKKWIENHPLTEFSLKKEAEDWIKIGKEFLIDQY
ncbi:Ppx/GppA phosphatase family protein [Polynucleobacter kasalickyi]|uniref:Ppx/GppA phosphatase n=1 Tax=Polynucleobacter kasalickyi TaxID=1938817 RepID=A0A1W1ZX09_9BURK|nr:Ppx/GppA phosphatase family protein [Polynucleobacter kasalickyi]SMC52608.1 Ppx/GppA phosphatase [Polynucleobacter kasalickyi]